MIFSNITVISLFSLIFSIVYSFDINNAVLIGDKQQIFFEKSIIKEIRLAQFETNPNIVRAVITFEEDFDLSSLAFRGVRGENGYDRHRADIVVSSGVLSGTFASSTMPKGRYVLNYKDSAVQLEKVYPLKIIVR